MTIYETTEDGEMKPRTCAECGSALGQEIYINSLADGKAYCGACADGSRTESITL